VCGDLGVVLGVVLESRRSCCGRMGLVGGKMRDMIELCILSCCEPVRLPIVPESFHNRFHQLSISKEAIPVGPSAP
jgi:hypothetical protein